MQVLNFTVDVDSEWSDEHEQTLYTGVVKLGETTVFVHDLNYIHMIGEAEAETAGAFANALFASLMPWQPPPS